MHSEYTNLTVVPAREIEYCSHRLQPHPQIIHIPLRSTFINLHFQLCAINIPLAKPHTYTIKTKWHGSYISELFSQERSNHSLYKPTDSENYMSLLLHVDDNFMTKTFRYNCGSVDTICRCPISNSMDAIVPCA